MSVLDLNLVAVLREDGSAALGGISLSVDEGELLVVAGPRGAGKTLLLRCIAGLLAPSSGDIAIDGRRINRMAPASRDLAMSFQGDALYPHLSVAENLTYGVTRRRLEAATIADRLAGTAAALGLADHLDRRPAALSAGQRRRVAIGRAVMRAPRVLLLDEPLAGLEAGDRADLRAALRAFPGALGAAMVATTSEEADALALGQQMALLSEGRIVESGAPAALYERPQTLQAARFLGEPGMNLVPIEVGAMTGAIHLERGISLTGRFAGLADKAPGGLLLGIRPQNVVAVADGAPADFEATVLDLWPAGGSTLYSLLAGVGTALTMQVAGRPGWPAGSRLPIVFERGGLHFFEATTGRRIERA